MAGYSVFFIVYLLPLAALFFSDWCLAASCTVLGQVLAELGFSVQQLSEEDTSVKFDLQIVRYGPGFWSKIQVTLLKQRMFGPSAGR